MRNLHPKNNMLEAIRSGRPASGTFNYIRDSSVIELLAEAGLDYVIIDTEHAVMDRETVENLIITSQLNNITPLVRVAGIIPPLMRSFLEMGAQGILVPHICSAEDCRAAQDAMRYPPDGHASTCRSNRCTGYSGANWLSYLDWVKDAPLIAMIEDPEGIANLDEILSELKPGRDMIMFGKADYTQSLGLFDASGSVDSRQVEEASELLAGACRERGLYFMIVPASYTADGIEKAVQAGGHALCFGVDQNVLMDAFKKFASDTTSTSF